MWELTVLGVIYTLIIVIPFIISYFNLKEFIKSVVNKEFEKAKKKLSKDKLFEILFNEEKIKYYIIKKLEDLDRFNYSIAIFYLNFGLIILVLYFLATNGNSINQVYYKLFEAFLYTFFGITLTLFTYLLIKIWIHVKIINYLIKLDELEISYIKEIKEYAEEENDKKEKQ
jgi:hypothetical protein